MLARTSPFRFQIRIVVSLEAVMINFPGEKRQRSGAHLGLKLSQTFQRTRTVPKQGNLSAPEQSRKAKVTPEFEC